MVGAFLLAVWGIVMAVVADSGVILLDGMFNFISGIMSVFSIEITRLISGKETREYPLGYFAFESLFVFVKGASILILVLMALYSNIDILLSGGREPALGLMTIYVVLAVIGCSIIYAMTRKSLKQTDSDILAAETQAWLVNAVISGAIGIAFGVVMLIQGTSWGWIDRYVDQVLVIILSILVIKDPLKGGMNTARLICCLVASFGFDHLGSPCFGLFDLPNLTESIGRCKYFRKYYLLTNLQNVEGKTRYLV